MKAIINLYLKQFFTGKLLFLLAGCLLFSIGERQNTSVSYELYVLHMLTEHYYLTYLMVPMYLLFFYQSLESLPAFVLIRTRYFWKSFFARAAAIFMTAFGFVGLQVIIFLLVGMGLKRSNQFPADFLVELEVARLLGHYFPNPVMAIVVVALFMVVGLATVSIAMLAFHHFFGEKATLAMMIGLYICMTFGIKIPGAAQIPFIFIDSYIIFHHNFSYQGKLIVTIVSMVMIYATVYVVVKHYWQYDPEWNWKWRRSGMGRFYRRQLFTAKNIWACVGIILTISLWKATTLEEATYRDYVTALFYGHGSSEFHLFSFLEMIIMNSTPLYVLAVFLEEEKRDRNLAITIRLKKKVSWLYAVSGAGMAFIAIYVLGFIMIGGIVGIVFEFRGQAIVLALNTAILKFLDLFAQFLWMILLYTLRRNITWAFLGVMIVNLLSIWFVYVPAGMSSIARSEEMGGLSFVMRMSILLISQLIIWIYVRTVSYKKIFQ
ncbi:hypothetical protein [Siminovitchia sp. FSL W7-1587]|uniref:hypothetical protein n=1 Tax=Siminovitchia sp. FSL W7-1587 TaxID=2954699 RepID=UPI0030CF6427